MKSVQKKSHPSPVLHGLPPICAENTKVLILGSFPGAASLLAQQYYAHPRNQFWPLLAAIWPQYAMPDDYAGRCRWLLQRGLGLWDVYARCERQGSLDSAIEHAELNDFEALHKRCSNLQLVGHNGAQSYAHAKQVGFLAAQVVKLPSSSPANASWSFARKLAAWQSAMAQAHVLGSSDFAKLHAQLNKAPSKELS